MSTRIQIEVMDVVWRLRLTYLADRFTKELTA